ncbi:MAG: GumC family protein, partial [Anaerovoracaceae bacterium]
MNNYHSRSIYMDSKDNSEKYSEEVDIQKYLIVLKRRWGIVTGIFATFVALGVVNFFIQPTTYEASGKLLLQLNRTSSLTGFGEKIGNLEAVGSVASNPLNTQALLVQSEPIIQEVINNLQLKDRSGVPLKPEAIAVTVDIIAMADGLKVSHVSRDAKLAKEIVNQTMKSYIASNILHNRSEAIAAGAFIAKQLPQAKIDLERASEALSQFKVDNKIVDLKEEESGTVKTILALDEELNSARSQAA